MEQLNFRVAEGFVDTRSDLKDQYTVGTNNLIRIELFLDEFIIVMAKNELKID